VKHSKDCIPPDEVGARGACVCVPEAPERNLQSLCDRLGEVFNTDDTPDELSHEAREAIEELWEQRDRYRAALQRIANDREGIARAELSNWATEALAVNS
jgi:hypothetical protein